IVVDSIPGDPVPFFLSGTMTIEMTIPAVSIEAPVGDILKSQLGSGVFVTLPSATTADTLATFSSRGPASGTPTRLKPDLAAPGLNIVLPQTGNTCIPPAQCTKPDPSGFLPGGQSDTESGTSIASPYVAGALALLKQLHPDWSSDELKALV